VQRRRRIEKDLLSDDDFITSAAYWDKRRMWCEALTAAGNWKLREVAGRTGPLVMRALLRDWLPTIYTSIVGGLGRAESPEPSLFAAAAAAADKLMVLAV